MTLSQFKIREIQATDNLKIAQTIREILIEFVVPKAGTDYEDEILDTLFEAYNVKNAIYYILKKKGSIVGGAGVSQLDNFKGNVCELQKKVGFSQMKNRMGDTGHYSCNLWMIKNLL